MRCLLPTCLLAISLLTLGCESLIIRDQDDQPTKVGKVAARTILGLATFGISESWIGDEERQEAKNERNRKKNEEHAEFVNRMNSLIGKLSYENALSAWGPPTQTAEAGGVFVAEWEAKYVGFFDGTSYEYGNRSTLWFDSSTKLLTKWDKKEW